MNARDRLEKVAYAPNDPIEACWHCKWFQQLYRKGWRNTYNPTFFGCCSAGKRIKYRQAHDTCELFELRKEKESC